MECVYLGVGSNLGERGKQIDLALRALQGILEELTVSRIYESRPLYYRNQPLFLNAVCRGYTSYSPQKLLRAVKSLEHSLGRRRKKAPRFGPRAMDLDILLYGDRVVTRPGLEIPHPRLQERAFVLLPLLELAPFLADPRNGLPIWKYLLKIGDQGVYFHSFSRYTLAEGKNKSRVWNRTRF
jgi:2-amino-4-hydroxy-6-hydroxymethyldihydropteridine diphosphokinase